VTLPAITPETTPLVLPMEAIDASELDHVPEPGEPLRVVASPTHTALLPVMAGNGFMVTVAVVVIADAL